MNVRKLLFIITSVTVLLPLSAQRFNGGLTLGINASQIDGDNYKGYYNAGITAGGFVNTYFNKMIGGQMEMKYIGKGASKKTAQGDNTFYKTKLSYVAVPVNVLIRAHESFWAETGIETAYLIKAREDLDGNGYLIPSDPSYENIDLSWIAGINYIFLDNFRLNARYSYSVIPIRDHPGDQKNFVDGGQNNKCVSFSIFYQFQNR